MGKVVQIATPSWVRLGASPGPMQLQATSREVFFDFNTVPPTTDGGVTIEPGRPYDYLGSENVYIKLRSAIALGGQQPGGAAIYTLTEASGETPIASTFTGTGQSASFTPVARRAFNVSIWGTFGATVQLERSFDAGATWLPITAAGFQLYVWTAPASEMAQEDQASVLYRLNCTAMASGTVNYRISQ